MKALIIAFIAILFCSCSNDRDVNFRAKQIEYHRYGGVWMETNTIDILCRDSAFKAGDTINTINDNFKWIIIERVR